MTEIATPIDFASLLKQREKVRKNMNKWANLFAELEILVRENCPHDKTETTNKGYSGGYDYVDEYHTFKKCLICNKELEHQIKYGNSFG
jgi:hypothetical protein